VKRCSKCGQEIKTTVVAQKILDKNSYFIFRDDGTEIPVLIKDGLLKCKHYLTKQEIKYFKNKL
jgi:hypothetical protein